MAVWFSFTVTEEGEVNTGGSFTGVTEMVTLAVSDIAPLSSLMVYANPAEVVSEPSWVNVTVPLLSYWYEPFVTFDIFTDDASSIPSVSVSFDNIFISTEPPSSTLILLSSTATGGSFT